MTPPPELSVDSALSAANCSLPRARPWRNTMVKDALPCGSCRNRQATSGPSLKELCHHDARIDL